MLVRATLSFWPRLLSMWQRGITCTVASQLLYEIQGPLCFGSDVTACIDGVVMTEEGQDFVRVTAVKGLPQSITTKIGIAAFSGYQAKFDVYICGIDLEAKAEWIERYSVGGAVKELSCFKFSLNGYCPDNPQNQDFATCDLCILCKRRTNIWSKNLRSMCQASTDGVWTTICKAAQAGHWVTTSDSLRARSTTNTI